MIPGDRPGLELNGRMSRITGVLCLNTKCCIFWHRFSSFNFTSRLLHEDTHFFFFPIQYYIQLHLVMPLKASCQTGVREVIFLIQSSYSFLLFQWETIGFSPKDAALEKGALWASCKGWNCASEDYSCYLVMITEKMRKTSLISPFKPYI